MRNADRILFDAAAADLARGGEWSAPTDAYGGIAKVTHKGGIYEIHGNRSSMYRVLRKEDGELKEVAIDVQAPYAFHVAEGCVKDDADRAEKARIKFEADVAARRAARAKREAEKKPVEE